MPQYMLALFEDPKTFQRYTPEQLQKVMEEYSSWAARVAKEGRIAGGHKLGDEGGRILRRDGAKVSIVDGPYAESKEVLAGYFLVNAEDYAQAVEIARTCPHVRYGTQIHVRELDARCEVEGE